MGLSVRTYLLFLLGHVSCRAVGRAAPAFARVAPTAAWRRDPDWEGGVVPVHPHHDPHPERADDAADPEAPPFDPAEYAYDAAADEELAGLTVEELRARHLVGRELPRVDTKPRYGVKLAGTSDPMAASVGSGSSLPSSADVIEKYRTQKDQREGEHRLGFDG